MSFEMAFLCCFVVTLSTWILNTLINWHFMCSETTFLWVAEESSHGIPEGSILGCHETWVLMVVQANICYEWPEKWKNKKILQWNIGEIGILNFVLLILKIYTRMKKYVLRSSFFTQNWYSNYIYFSQEIQILTIFEHFVHLKCLNFGFKLKNHLFYIWITIKYFWVFLS